MSAPPERVVLFGSEGGFSLPVLQQLLSAGVTVAGLVVPGRAATDPARRDLPVAVEQAHPSTLTGLAVTHAVPVLRAGEHSPGQLAGELSGLGAEVLLVACYPLAIPATVWQRPGPACWNLHPSLLPKYRGPTPLYWQLHLHERETGITLHEVSGRLDAGAIVAQSCHALPADASAAALDEWVARHGVALFLDALAAHRRGRLRPVPQDEAAASYYPDPAQAGSTRH